MPPVGKVFPGGGWRAANSRGSSRTSGAPGCVQCRVTSVASADVASARSVSDDRPSIRGTAAAKCCFCGV